jgi:hypothetical protein
MRWFVAEKNSTLARIVLSGLLGVLAVVIQAQPAAAVDTEVGVSVCGQNSLGASITITQPNDDSIVNQSVTTFRGTINNTSQIIITVDGAYVSTLAIGSNQTEFATDISLDEGTHTILMTANDICGTQDASDTIVITYQQTVEPSNGGTTPTEVDQPATNAVNTENTISDKDVFHQIQQIPVIGAAISVVADFVAASGLESTVTNGNVVSGVSRVGVTVVALTSVVMAGTLAPIAAQAVPGVGEVFNIASNRSMLYLGWVIRGAGILAMAFAYFL